MVTLSHGEIDQLVAVILADDKLFQYVMKLISVRVQPQSMRDDKEWATQVIDLTIVKAFEDVRIGDMVRSIVREMGLNPLPSQDHMREKERERRSTQSQPLPHTHTHTHTQPMFHTQHTQHTQHTHDSRSEIQREVERQQQQQRDKQQLQQSMSRTQTLTRLPSLSQTQTPLSQSSSSPLNDRQSDSGTPSHASSFSPSLSDDYDDAMRPNYSFSEPEPVSFTDPRRRVKEMNKRQPLSESKAHLSESHFDVLRISEKEETNTLLAEREKTRNTPRGSGFPAPLETRDSMLSIEIDEREPPSEGESEKQNLSFVSGSEASTVKMLVAPVPLEDARHRERERYAAHSDEDKDKGDEQEEEEDEERERLAAMKRKNDLVRRNGRASPGKPQSGSRRGFDLHVDVDEEEDDVQQQQQQQRRGEDKDDRALSQRIEKDLQTPLSTMTMSTTFSQEPAAAMLSSSSSSSREIEPRRESQTRGSSREERESSDSQGEISPHDSLDLHDDEPVRDWERKVLQQLERERENERERDEQESDLDAFSAQASVDDEDDVMRADSPASPVPASFANEPPRGLSIETMETRETRETKEKHEGAAVSDGKHDTTENYEDDYEAEEKSEIATAKEDKDLKDNKVKGEDKGEREEEEEEIFKPALSLDHDDFKFMRDLDDPLSPAPRPHQPLYFDQSTFDAEVDCISEGKPVRRVIFSEKIVAETYFREKTAPFEKSTLFYSHEEESDFCRAQAREYEKADAMGLTWMQYMDQRDDHDALLDEAENTPQHHEDEFSYGYDMEFEDADFEHDVEHYYDDEEEIAKKSVSGHLHSHANIHFSDDLPEFETNDDDDENDHDESSNF